MFQPLMSLHTSACYQPHSAAGTCGSTIMHPNKM